MRWDVSLVSISLCAVQETSVREQESYKKSFPVSAMFFFGETNNGQNVETRYLWFYWYFQMSHHKTLKIG